MVFSLPSLLPLDEMVSDLGTATNKVVITLR
jgi:hypothetical protein